MSIKERFKRKRDQLVINQVARAKLPEFADGEIIRTRVVFEGRVQKVGFRLEVEELAKRLGLTGHCENLDSGAVRAELQGPVNRIEFLIDFMHSLKRIKITNMSREMLEIIPEESGFVTG